MTSHRKERAPTVHPLNISYERLLPLIRDLLEFKWPKTKETNPYDAILIGIMGMRLTGADA